MKSLHSYLAEQQRKSTNLIVQRMDLNTAQEINISSSSESEYLLQPRHDFISGTVKKLPTINERVLLTTTAAGGD
jgi:hypothetical protein